MNKIISVKLLGENKFKVAFYSNGVKHKENITYKKDLWLESLEEFMPYLIPESRNSSELARCMIIFRNELFRLIELEIEKSKPELQTA